MRSIFYLAIFILFGFYSLAQEAFTVHVVPSAITAAPAIHSCAFASYNNKWIFIGGRKDGMHLMQTNQSFPVYGRNDSIYIVDPIANTYQAVTAKSLPGYTYESICSSNMQYYQDGNFLYMIGGYGSEDSSAQWITFPTLTSINLDSLLNAIAIGSSISGSFRLLLDSSMAVTGGELGKIDTTYFLVCGQQFDGRYADPPAAGLFTQRYTHDVRKFSIHDDGINLSIQNYVVAKDTDVYHRRDFNLVEQIFPNFEYGYTLFGGVFQKGINQPFLTPIDISQTSIQHQLSFNENLNQYTTATMPVYDSLHNHMHTIFFGGISLYRWDTVANMMVQDTTVPFVNTISKVTRDSVGNLFESRINENMPSFKGTNAIFIPDPSVMSYDGKIINLNALTGNTRVGFIAGGIHADQPNVARIDPLGLSRPNSVLYEVYIDKNVNSIPELKVVNDVNNLMVFPNPAHESFTISFNSPNENSFEIKLFDVRGKLIQTLLKNKKYVGQQSFSFSSHGIANGIYTCVVTSGKSAKTVTFSITN